MSLLTIDAKPVGEHGQYIGHVYRDGVAIDTTRWCGSDIEALQIATAMRDTIARAEARPDTSGVPLSNVGTHGRGWQRGMRA